MYFCPPDATHEWTAAREIPYVFQRRYYKKVNDIWYSYTHHNTWEETNNPKEWFDEEIKLGYFKEIK